MLGAKGNDHFFGQALFESESLPARAFISNYQELGYYKDDTLIVLSPKKKTEAYKIDPVTYEAEKAPMNAELLEEAIACETNILMASTSEVRFVSSFAGVTCWIYA